MRPPTAVARARTPRPSLLRPRRASTRTTKINARPLFAIDRRTHAPSNGETAEKLVSQRLALRDGAQPAVVHPFRVQLHRTFRHLEPALHERGQLTNASTLFAEHVRRARGADDDFRAHRGLSRTSTPEYPSSASSRTSISLSSAKKTPSATNCESMSTRRRNVSLRSRASALAIDGVRARARRLAIVRSRR